MRSRFAGFRIASPDTQPVQAGLQARRTRNSFSEKRILMLFRLLSPRFALLLLAAVVCQYDAWAGSAVPAATATASQDLPTKYGVDKAVDGDPKTHWAANNKPPVWLRVEFAQPAQVDTLRILGVWQQSIYDNWRRVTVSFSDGSTFTVTLADTWHWHTLTFAARKTQWVKLTIESTYKRTHYVGCEEIEARLAGHGRTTVAVEPKPKASPAVTPDRMM